MTEYWIQTCIVCGKEFKVPASWNGIRFCCSIECKKKRGFWN